MKIPGVLVFCLLIYLPQHGNSVFVIDIMKATTMVAGLLYKSWQTFEPKFEGPNAPTFHTNREDKIFMNRLVEITRQINTLSEQVEYQREKKLMGMKELISEVLFEIHLRDMLNWVAYINDAYEDFDEFMQAGINGLNSTTSAYHHDVFTLQSFATQTVSFSSMSVLTSMKRISDKMSSNANRYGNVLREKGFFKRLEEAFGSKLSCEHHQSLQQLLFNVYTDLQLVQLKGYTMVQFSYMILRLYNKGNFTTESESFRQKYLHRISEQAKSIVEDLKTANNAMTMCDADIQIRGVTYDHVTKFLQGYIVNEVDLNNEQTCSENCAYYKYARQHGCFKDNFCSKQPMCRGKIVGCTFVESDMHICQGDRHGFRRYDYIEYKNGRTLGQKRSCFKATQVDSWWRYLFWHCSYCFCYCDDSSDRWTHRYFSLQSALSNTTENKVITGLRFVKYDKVFYLQIQEGRLIENGQIDPATIEWKPVNQIDIDSNQFTPGKDYHTLSWEKRGFDLDDLYVPKNHVLTGVRLRMLGAHMNLEIQGTEIDFSSGELINAGTKSTWLSNDNTDASEYNERTKVTLFHPDIPIKRISDTYSEHNQFLEFQSSDLDLDAGQTTVPYIDVQAVVPYPPIPLVGAGIYHKGTKYSGGFLAPKVFTYNFTTQISQLNLDDVYGHENINAEVYELGSV